MAFAVRGLAFGERDLLAFEFGDALLIGGDDRVGGGGDDAVEQRADLLLDGLAFAPAGFRDFAGLRQTLVPGVLEHGARCRHQALRRRQRPKEFGECAFDAFTPHRFAVAVAAFAEAHVIRMAGTSLASGPAGGQRFAAMGAGDGATQREIGADIGAGGRKGFTAEAALHALESLERHDGFVPALVQRQAPIGGGLHVARIDGLGHDVLDQLLAHPAMTVLRKVGMRLEEAGDLDLLLEAARGEAFEAFLNDRGQRLVAHQNTTLACLVNVLQANAGDERPVAVEEAGAHAVLGLLGTFLTGVLAHRGQQVLDQNGIGILAELDGRAFQPRANTGDGAAQIEMGTDVPREARDVVNEDDIDGQGHRLKRDGIPAWALP